MKIRYFTISGLFLLSIFFLLILSCQSFDDSQNRPQRTTVSVRLDDIARHVNDNPITALNMIYIFKEVYQVTDDNQNEDWVQLSQYESEAIENLRLLQLQAIEEGRWEEAVSFGRSITSIGVTTEFTGREYEFILEDAKKMLQEGNSLGAFLAAVRSHEINPMSWQDAVLFLEGAVEARQRRTAAYFFAAAQRAGASNINASFREYATGRDSVSDMINGVATVIVDRGYRIERGMGVPDRIIGSAFFVDTSGLMITNYHVIESEVDPRYRGYSRLFIRMGDATSPRIPARVVGWDKALDLALIRAEIEPEYVFSIVDRVIPRVGDTVLAIGSPVGLERTVTSGIVSALGRRILQIGDFIQVDAAVNHGNSGGPIVDNEGRLVGIVFAGLPQFQGLNFAIPAEMLAAALPAMMKGGRAARPWLGVTVSETFYGVQINYTAPNTPAFLHRVNEGSLLNSINGKTITAAQGAVIPALQRELFNCGPGELVAIVTADSNGVTKRHILMTVARPEVPLLEASRLETRERLISALYGMVLTPLQSGLFVSNYRVDRIVRGSVADEAGISVNDPVTISRLRILEDNGIALLEISVKKRRLGYMETSMQLPAWLDTPDTL